MAEQHPSTQGYQYFLSGSSSSSSSQSNSQINLCVHPQFTEDPIGYFDPYAWPKLQPQYDVSSFVPRHNITYPQTLSVGSFPSSAHIAPSHSYWAATGYAQPSFESPKHSIPRQDVRERDTNHYYMQTSSKDFQQNPQRTSIKETNCDQVSPLCPIRKVSDTVTGKSCYLMDPLRPSNSDFQRRGCDEATKFFHIVIEYASAQTGLRLLYEVRDKDGGKTTEDASKVLGTLSLDFRWQMKHFQYNRDIYSKKIFCGHISTQDLERKPWNLRKLIDSHAHQQNLSDNYKFKERANSDVKCGASKQITEFFESLISLVDDMTQCLKINNIPASTGLQLQVHCGNLHEVYQSYKESCQCRDVQFHNMSYYEKMGQREKKESAIKFLHVIQEQVQRDEGEDLVGLILLQFASRVNLKIDNF